MKRTFVALAIAFSVIVGTVQATPASAQALEEPSVSSSSSSEEGSSAGPIVAIVALIAAVGGGAFWAVQQGLMPNPLPGVIPGSPHPAPAPAPAPRRGVCTPEEFNNALWQWRGSRQTNIEYCDGRFAWVQQSQTDWRVAFEFDGQQWSPSRTVGTKKTGLTQGCYDGIELRNKGASEDFLSRIPICTPDEIGYSPR